MLIVQRITPIAAEPICIGGANFISFCTLVSAITIAFAAAATDEIGAVDEKWLTLYFEASFVPGDANGDCLVIGADITYLVSYFRGIGNPPIIGDCPPPPSVRNIDQ